MENKRVLVKTNAGPADKVTHDQHQAWNEALHDLSSAQFDRYCRAVKVWYHPHTHTFEYEDKS